MGTDRDKYVVGLLEGHFDGLLTPRGCDFISTTPTDSMLSAPFWIPVRRGGKRVVGRCNLAWILALTYLLRGLRPPKVIKVALFQTSHPNLHVFITFHYSWLYEIPQRYPQWH